MIPVNVDTVLDTPLPVNHDAFDRQWITGEDQRIKTRLITVACKHRIIVDAGSGMRERLFEAGGFDLITGVDHVLVTHLHFDHTISIPGLWLSGWLYGRRVPKGPKLPII